MSECAGYSTALTLVCVCLCECDSVHICAGVCERVRVSPSVPTLPRPSASAPPLSQWTPEYERYLTWPHPALKVMSKLIATSLNGSRYAAVHVRRGDKLLQPQLWPRLDADTRPER